MDRPSQEREAVGGALLGRVRRRQRRPRPSRHLRVQRRPRSIVRVPAHGRRRAAARRLSVGRLAAARAAAPGRQRRVVARVHRPRLRRSRRDRLQPRRREGEGGEGRRREEEGRGGRSEGVLRLQAEPPVALGVHQPLAVDERPLGLACVHRRRELRRISRRQARPDAAGGSRRRAERRDPDLAGARVRRAEQRRLRRARLGRPRSRR